MPPTQTVVQTHKYRLTLDPKAWSWSLQLGFEQSPFLVARQGLLLAPEILGCSPDKGSATVESSRTPAGHQRILITALLSGAVGGKVVNDIFCLPDRLVCANRAVLVITSP